MTQLDKRITARQFHRIVQPVLGLRVSRPWLGYGDVLFLELGKLRTETTHLPGRKTLHTRRGQATLLIHSNWRAETRDRFAFGSGLPHANLVAATRGLRGRKVTGISMEGRLPELVLELDGTLLLRSFNSRGLPDWQVFLEDADLFPREARWAACNHALLVGTSSEGGLVRSVCY